MPGREEEPFFRGTLLAALCLALPGGGVRVLGARIALGGLLASMLFGFVHGLRIVDGALQFAPEIVFITGMFGFGLYWIRARTGSVLMPILAHNLMNFSGSFF